MKLIIFLTTFSFVCVSIAQNLILNGDFEDFSKCPKGLHLQEKQKTLKFVSNPNQGSFDFFHECDDDKYPRYQWGTQSSQSGKGFVGIGVFLNKSVQTEEVREYVQLELKDSLVEGNIYLFEMYLSLADKWHISINKLGVYFSNELIQINNTKVIPVLPDIISSDFYSNKIEWDLFSGDYIAHGGEKYVVIGNFNKDKNVQIKVVDSGPIIDNYVYYFIDNVSLKLNTNLSEGITLNNINFKTGSAELLTSSNIELDKIVTVLETNVKYKVKIIGHTDNVGNETENIKLSKDRALEVLNYLVKKGVNKDRLSYYGLGSNKPIGDNEAEEGRAKNRRVELRFL